MTEFVSPVVKSEGSFFREEKLVVELLTQCSQLVPGDSEGDAKLTSSAQPEFQTICASAAKVMTIIETYQEQPAILDASLEVMVTPIMAGFRQAVARHTEHVMNESKATTSSSASTSTTTTTTAFPFGRFTSTRLIRLSKLLYTVCKVRGYKKVVRLFPHEVADLEPVFHLLQAQDTDDHETWHVRYSLLLWLSIIVIVPFDLQTIDSSFNSKSSNGTNGSSNGPSLVDRIISVCKTYLRDSGPARNAAALCLSKLLTRPDMEARHLDEFLTWANTVVSASVNSGAGSAASAAGVNGGAGNAAAGGGINGGEEKTWEERAAMGHVLGPSMLKKKIKKKSGVMTGGAHQHQQIFLSTGALETLVLVFKHGHRQQMEGRIPAVAECMDLATRATTMGRSSTLQRKLTMKLSQRVGLQYLPPRVAKWRYKRGQRSLLDNMTKASAADGTGGKKVETKVESPEDDEEDDDEDEEEEEVPEETDAVIETLLCGLRDKDTVVRWSAAKGVGRLTGRLPREYADQVVEEVLELLSDGESDGAWHGGCLALAELARRGLLLPSRLHQVVPLVCRAIVYDVRRGKHSIGSHVRDAACYVCWAFARAYEPKEMYAYVEELSRAMMTTALFDREVNCRRAASAAFQENVGRQGHENFPNGIDILTRADYFTLGNRTSAYLEIAPFVASFPLYRRAIIDHLADVKSIHWDPSLRQLAANALGALTPLDPSYMVEVILPKMVASTLDRNDLLVRHGNALCTASLIRAIAKLGAAAPPLGDALSKDIRNLIPRLEKARLYRGRGGEIMRGAACRILESIATAGHSLTRRAQLRLLETIDECIKHPTVDISEAAADALGALTREYFPEEEERRPSEGPSVETSEDAASTTRKAEMEENLERMPIKYSTILQTDDNPGARRGFALALGALPYKYVAKTKKMCDLVLSTLVASADPKKNKLSKGAPDAETRRNAVISLGRLSGIVLVERESCTDKQAMELYEMVVLATGDYETDSRGAVGSWVRRAALNALPKVLRGLRLREMGESGKRPTDVETSFEVSGAAVEVADEAAAAGESKQAATAAAATSSAAFPMCSPPVVEKAICALLCQLCGKIDVVREDAGRALVAVLSADAPSIPCVPMRAALQQLVHTMQEKTSSSGAATGGGWGIPSVVFPAMVPLIVLEPFRTSILDGFKDSIGDINESSAKSARQALLTFVGGLRKDKQYVALSSVADSLLSIVNRREGREFESIMKTIALLLENGAFDFMDPSKSNFAEKLLEAASSTMLKSREYKRIVAGMHVCCALTSFAQPVSGKAMSSILLLLAHLYPIVRKVTADKLYSALLQYEIPALPVASGEEDADETVDEMSDVLLETPWAEGSMDTVLESRNSLYEVLKMDVPVKSARDLMVGGGNMYGGGEEEKDELDDYSALVKEMHG